MKNNLNIAIPVEKQKVSTDVEHCANFFRFEIDLSKNRVACVTLLDIPPTAIKERIFWLSERCVDMLLFSGINPTINEICAEKGIAVLSGFLEEKPLRAIERYLKNRSTVL
ncbi:hypothetical protein KKA14_15375 [bacterium]|nr:hypothetical protein [bacterium]